MGDEQKIGAVELWKKRRTNISGPEFATHKDYSEETARTIDVEVQSLVMGNYEKAKKLLNEHIDVLHKIANELLEKEVLNGEEIDALIGDALPKQQQTAYSKSIS